MSELRIAEDEFKESREAALSAAELVRDPDTFTEAFEAFRASDGERFRGALERVGLLDRCRLILSVAAQGNSSLSVPVTGVPEGSPPGSPAVPLSKMYNGNTADHGYPVPTSFIWDPWAGSSPAVTWCARHLGSRAVEQRLGRWARELGLGGHRDRALALSNCLPPLSSGPSVTTGS